MAGRWSRRLRVAVAGGLVDPVRGGRQGGAHHGPHTGRDAGRPGGLARVTTEGYPGVPLLQKALTAFRTEEVSKDEGLGSRPFKR
jgi:hypothetical protein